MVPLENDLIKLRAVETSDIDLIYEWENNPDIWLVSNTLTPFSKHIIKKYIETAHLDIYETKQLRLMIETKNGEKEKTIGAIDLFDFDPRNRRAGIGILIGDKKSRRNGYASASLNILIPYAFKTLLLHQLYCNISVSNKASLNLFKSNGFKIVGEKKEWLFTGKEYEGEYFLQLINHEL